MRLISLVKFSLFFVFLYVVLGLNYAYSSSENNDLKINLIVSEEKLMIYAGPDKGIEIGQKYNVIRNGKVIGKIEITDVKKTYSVGKILEKTQDIQELDVIRLEGAVTTAAKTEPAKETQKEEKKPAEKKEEVKETKTTKKDTAKSEKSTTSSTKSSKRRSSRTSSKSEDSSTEKTDESSAKKTVNKESTSSRRSSSGRGGSSRSKTTKKEDTGNADEGGAEGAKDGKVAEAAKKEKKKVDPRELAFPCENGMSGLWTIPTTDIIPKGKYALSYYQGSLDESKYKTESVNNIFTYINSWSDYEQTAISVTYGVSENLELSISQINREGNVSSFNDNVYSEYKMDSEGNSIALKYNPRKKFLLKKDTNKEWSFAFAVERSEVEDVDGTKFYALMNVPTKKIDFNLGLYHFNFEGIVGKRQGTMAGIEIPFDSNLEFIGEMNLFQGDYTWSYAARYIHNEVGSILVGISDTTGMNYKSIGASYKF